MEQDGTAPEAESAAAGGAILPDAAAVTPEGASLPQGAGRVPRAIDSTRREDVETAVAERLQMVALSADVGMALNRGGELREMLGDCASAIVERLDAAFARIWTLDPGANVLELQASAGMYTHLDGARSRIPVGQWKTGLIAQERVPYLTNSVPEDPRIRDREWARREGMVAFAGYPLIAENQVVGVMAAFARHPFAQATLDTLASVAAGVAQGILRKRAEERLRRYASRLETLHGIDHAILSAQSVERLAQGALGKVCDLLPCQRASLVLFDHQAQEAVVMAVHLNGHTTLDRGTRIPLADYADIDPARRGQIQVTADIEEMDEPAAVFQALTREGIRSSAQIPLWSDGVLLGALNVGCSAPGPFSPEALEIAREVADQVAVAIRQAQLREEANRHAAELEQRVEARTVELHDANQRLQEAAERLRELDQLKSQFVSNVTHELRTPLASIKLYLSLLKDGKPEKRQRYMETLEREADRLGSLIEGILDLSRLDLGKVQPAMAELDLNQLVTVLVKDRKALAAERGLALYTNVDPGLPPIEADARMLMQVLTNLMANAMNYTPCGGSITIQTRAEEALGSAWVSLSVEDTGVGIDPGERAHLFERFFRGEAARQTGAAGTGLGLAICKEIVDRHGGRIAVDSEAGKGSVFTIRLPAAMRSDTVLNFGQTV